LGSSFVSLPRTDQLRSLLFATRVSTMSTARLGRNWADVDEEDDEDVIADGSSKLGARCFETPVDENGIKTVIEYKERDGKTYKVSKRVKQTTVTKWSNPEMAARKQMPKFGKALENGPVAEAQHIVRSVEVVSIEICRKAVQMSQAHEAEDKFYEEALKACDNLFKEKKVWSAANQEKQEAADAGAAAPKPGETAPAAAAAPAAAGAPGKYVPPSVRAAAAGGKGGKDGKGKGSDDVEASLRITNLSDDVKEGDLQDLFGQFGRLQRVYLSKDMLTGLSKGFAFITYYTREDAQKAINKLNGHGYDNLILNVMWAKPKGP